MTTNISKGEVINSPAQNDVPHPPFGPGLGEQVTVSVNGGTAVSIDNLPLYLGVNYFIPKPISVDSGYYELSKSNSSRGSIGGSSSSPSQLPQPVTIVLSSGNDEDQSDTRHRRTTSGASLYSESHGSAHHSSSSSLSCDLSQASFNSKELLEHLMGSSGEVEMNDVVQQLLEHIVSLKLKLEEMRLENAKLKQLRSTMDDELHTLTENLFEEAYKMVDTAKEEKGSAVKKLADAAGKIDAMETEMSALKNLLHTPSSSMVAGSKSPSRKHRKSVKKALKKIGRKVKVLPKSPTGSGEAIVPLTLLEHRNEIKGAALREGEMMPEDYSEFCEWLSELADRPDHPYLMKVVEVDVRPCLNFKNKELSSQLVEAVRNNDLLMESLPPCLEEKRVCALSGCDKVCCTHRLQLKSSSEWLYISTQCRDRIAAACDFYMYIGHIEKGILKLERPQLYWQVARLRAMMTMARLTLQLPD